MPHAARLRCASTSGVTRISLSATSYFTRSSSSCIASLPLGPFTVSVPLSTAAVTPPGTAIGFLPIRDILEHLRQHFAADVLLARFRIGKHTTRRRDDHGSKAVADHRQLLARRIDATAGLGHAGQMLDRRLALEILKLDSKALLRANALFRIATDVAFALEHIEYADTQVRRRSHNGILACLLAVANAGEHITQGIGHRHMRWPLPARLRDARDQALVGQFPKHDPRQAEFAIIGARTPCQLAAVANARRVTVARKLRHLEPCDQ